MARKKKTPIGDTLVPDPRHLARIGTWYGKLCFLTDQNQAAHGYARVAVVDVGRPFQNQAPLGLVFDGMTGENAKPWSPSQVLAAAKFGLFGFQLAEAT